MTKPMRALLLTTFVVGFVLLLLPLAGSRRTAPHDTPSDADAERAGAGESSRGSLDGALRPFSFSARERPQPDSLEGTDVAGGLLVDADGNFTPTREAIELFDYFLSTVGERPFEEIVERIRAEIRRRLSPPADAQALGFLDRYLVYRERGIALGAPDGGAENLRARFERLRSLRREIFGEELAARLWGEDEAVAEVAVRQRELAAAPELTEQEKRARIEQLYDELPEPMREARRQALAAATLRADEAKILAEGGTAEDVHRVRVERFGEDAAERLAELDQRRAEWGGRVEDFRAERARILADPSLTEAQRGTAIARLLEERFDESERIRVEALDRIAAERDARD